MYIKMRQLNYTKRTDYNNSKIVLDKLFTHHNIYCFINTLSSK